MSWTGKYHPLWIWMHSLTWKLLKSYSRGFLEFHVHPNPLPFPKSESCSVMSNSFWSHRLYSPWNPPGQNTAMGSLSLLQRIFPTQRLNPGLMHCRWILYQLSHQGSPEVRELRLIAITHETVGLLGDQIHPELCRDTTQSSLATMSSKDRPITQENFKGLRSFVPGTRDKDQIYFYASPPCNNLSSGILSSCDCVFLYTDTCLNWHFR